MQNKYPLGRISSDIEAFKKALEDNSNVRVIGNFGGPEHMAALKHLGEIQKLVPIVKKKSRLSPK